MRVKENQRKKMADLWNIYYIQFSILDGYLQKPDRLTACIMYTLNFLIKTNYKM